MLAPLVKLAYCGGDNLGQDDRRGGRGFGQQIRKIVLCWLRGLIRTDMDSVPLRQQVRDRILEDDPASHDQFAVEAVATLGPDLDESSREFLQRLAAEGGSDLEPVVESAAAVHALSRHDPELLITLAEAYYIDAPGDDDWYGRAYGEGIREHAATGYGVPMAAWHYGPFFCLLRTEPLLAIALINRILDHAARFRVRRSGAEPATEIVTASCLPGLDLDLPGVGVRRCVGDQDVWSWYRGNACGPNPCVSALLAAERFADHLVGTVGIPVGEVGEFLLRDCHNLAMPGLFVGLLVRHGPRGMKGLDRWLTQPELWFLEATRITREGLLHVQDPDASDRPGKERRRHHFQMVVAEMVVNAKVRKDTDRLADLSSVAHDLIQNASVVSGPYEEPHEDLTVVELWASLFNPDNYHFRTDAAGKTVLQYEPPTDIAAEGEADMASLARGDEAWRLQTHYGHSLDRVTAVDQLIEDLALARKLAANPPFPQHGPSHLEDSIAAVASSAIVAHADGRASVAEDDLRWAGELLIEAARFPRIDELSSETTIYSMGADRSAAAALPRLLLPSLEGLGLDCVAVQEALQSCGRSTFNEVRAAFAVGIAPVWDAPCDETEVGGMCRHAAAWSAVQASLRDCRSGDWDSEGHRVSEPLEGPYEKTLPDVETERLRLDRLSPVVVAVASSARSGSCVSAAASCLLHALFNVHRRAWGHWARKGYGWPGARSEPYIPRVLVETTVGGDAGPLIDYVRAFASNPRALRELLDGLAVLFTYDQGCRTEMLGVWRLVMTTALDAIEAGADLLSDHYWSEGAVAAILPTPQIQMNDKAIDSTLARASRDWIAANEIEDLVDRWLPLAKHNSKAVDAVVRLVQCADPWQATTGLGWVDRLIDANYAVVADRCQFLIDWLESVRASCPLSGDDKMRWQHLVDGLAAEGDDHAIRLQRAQE